VDTKHLYLVFNPTRATLIQRAPGSPVPKRDDPLDGLAWLPGVRWSQTMDAFEGRPRAHFPHVIVLDVHPGALENAEEVVVHSLDERPELVMCIADQDGSAEVLQSTGDSGCLDTADLENKSVPGPGGALVPDVRTYLDETEQAIEALADEATRNASWFFFDLDRQSEEKLRSHYLAAGSPLLAAVDGLQPALEGRMRNRIQRRKSPPGLCGPEYFPVGDPMRRITDLFFGGLSQHLFANGPIVVADVERAFERFAAGQLRLRTASGFWSTQPSSGWYFYFAELALLGGEEGHVASALLTPAERAQWRDLANVLVRSQELFTKAYDPKHGDCAEPARRASPFPEDYCGCALDATVVTPRVIENARTKYAPFAFGALADQAAANAEAAFPGWCAAISACV
jgi:hypothetical protein